MTRTFGFQDKGREHKLRPFPHTNSLIMHANLSTNIFSLSLSLDDDDDDERERVKRKPKVTYTTDSQPIYYSMGL